MIGEYQGAIIGFITPCSGRLFPGGGKPFRAGTYQTCAKPFRAGTCFINILNQKDQYGNFQVDLLGPGCGGCKFFQLKPLVPFIFVKT